MVNDTESYFITLFKLILIQAKTQYEREERKREQAKARGEDTWMLPSLEKRIEKDKEVCSFV